MRTENGNRIRFMLNVYRSHSTSFAFFKVEAHNALRGGILFKTAVATASTCLGLIGLNRNVSNLATGTKRAGYQLAIGNHTGADALSAPAPRRRRRPRPAGVRRAPTG